ncbi:MAG: hypothetical protein ABR521_02155 [Gaiellaceae bacterium]
MLLIHRCDLGEKPENVLLSDVPIILTMLSWALLAATILVLT